LKLQGKQISTSDLALSLEQANKNYVQDSFKILDKPNSARANLAIPAFRGMQSSRQSPDTARISFKNISAWHNKELLKLNTIASTMQPDIAKLKHRLFTKSTVSTQEPTLLTERFVSKLKRVVAQHSASKPQVISIWSH
jgi:hypothetical protein